MEKVRILTASWIWWALITIFIPMVALGLRVKDIVTISTSALIGVFALWKLRNRNRFLARCTWLQKHGIPLTTTITHVQRSLFLYNYSYYTWKITSRANDNTGRTFYSDVLWSRRVPATVGTTVTIFLDPRDTTTYWMNVFELPGVIL